MTHKHPELAEGDDEERDPVTGQLVASRVAAQDADCQRADRAKLRALLMRVCPDGLRALDAGKPLPESGWYEITEHGSQQHIHAVWSPIAWEETQELRAALAVVTGERDRLREQLDRAKSFGPDDLGPEFA